jgi:hypothetical protein
VIIKSNRISSELPPSSPAKAERMVYHNENDNMPMQTEAEEADVYEHALIERLLKNVGITQLLKNLITSNDIDVKILKK